MKNKREKTIVTLHKNTSMRWNLDDIVFLHQPDHFLGRFDNPKMQERHERELERNLNDLKKALANESDPLRALRLLNPKDHIQFLCNNRGIFHRKELFEETVLALYCKENGPFSSGGDHSVWKQLFTDCDKENLRKCGTPVPPGLKTVYRGSLTGFPKGLAWTPDKKLAEKYAERWQDPVLGGGEIFEADIFPEDVLVYLQRKHENFVILSPECIRTAEIRSFTR